MESLRATVNGMPEPVGHNGCLASWGIDGDWAWWKKLMAKCGLCCLDSIGTSILLDIYLAFV